MDARVKPAHDGAWEKASESRHSMNKKRREQPLALSASADRRATGGRSPSNRYARIRRRSIPRPMRAAPKSAKVPGSGTGGVVNGVVLPVVLNFVSPAKPVASVPVSGLHDDKSQTAMWAAAS